MNLKFSLAGLSLGMLSGLAGCGKPSAPLAPVNPPALRSAASREAMASAPASTPLSAAELAALKPNEVGQVPILEYHALDDGKTTMSRSPGQFRRDLERLYREGYRPIALHDYLDNRINVPAGKSPVILTFDDARPTQFRYRPDGSLDPDSAVAILETFHREHADFPLRATFFVLPTAPGFGPAADRAKKLRELVRLGFEIGNHTLSHPALHRLSDAKVQEELAGCVTEIHKLAPDAVVDTLALPLGSHARNRSLEARGMFAGQTYANRASLLVGANPAPSPAARTFDPMRLPRIQACEGNCGITFWLDALAAHPARRYVSDGDPAAVTVPRDAQAQVDGSRLQGAALRTY